MSARRSLSLNSNSGLGTWLEIAKSLQQTIDAQSMGKSLENLRKTGYPTEVERFDSGVTDAALRHASRQLFSDGHYARAVEEAFKCLNNEVKSISGIDDRDGANLMRKVFSANDPTLMLNELQSLSEQDEQKGYMDLYAGSMTGIRNPRAHEHELEDSPEEALEMLIFANHLMRKLRSANKQ